MITSGVSQVLGAQYLPYKILDKCFILNNYAMQYYETTTKEDLTTLVWKISKTNAYILKFKKEETC